METMAKMAESPFQGLIPRLDTIRRVPSRYHSILPLELMKNYQFVVIGAAHGSLTVAIIDQRQRPILESLQRLTGRSIFFVYVNPARMCLIIDRIERSERRRCRQLLGCPYYLHRIQLQGITWFLFAKKTSAVKERRIWLLSRRPVLRPRLE
jgi:type II secretion system (T2SS) protein E